MSNAEMADEFTKMLQQAKAEAWDEGKFAERRGVSEHTFPDNPYRRTALPKWVEDAPLDGKVHTSPGGVGFVRTTARKPVVDMPDLTNPDVRDAIRAKAKETTRASWVRALRRITRG